MLNPMLFGPAHPIPPRKPNESQEDYQRRVDENEEEHRKKRMEALKTEATYHSILFGLMSVGLGGIGLIGLIKYIIS